MTPLTVGLLTLLAPDQYSSSSSNFSGRCLCFAFRPAGRAFGSGLARLNGCPGGASGRRIEPMIEGFRLPRLDREDFIVRGWGEFPRDAIAVLQGCQ